jgi:hypothetical protein
MSNKFDVPGKLPALAARQEEEQARRRGDAEFRASAQLDGAAGDRAPGLTARFVATIRRALRRG